MPTLGRLRLAQKFIIPGLPVLLVAAVPGALYVPQTAPDTAPDTAAVQREASGITPIKALQDMVRPTLQHRGIAAGMPGAMRCRRPGVPTP